MDYLVVNYQLVSFSILIFLASSLDNNNNIWGLKEERREGVWGEKE